MSMQPKTRSAISVFYFGFYIVVMGLLLLLIPNMLLNLVSVPMTNEGWIRMAGMLLLFMGFFYIQAGRHHFIPFFKWTLVTRSSAFVFILGFIMSGMISWVIFLFWLVDLAGTLWTAWALRIEGEF